MLSAPQPQSARPSVREQNRQRIRGAIARAAMESFASTGIADTTMDHIAEQAGVARATVFKHFPNKNAIVTTIIELMDADLLQQIEKHAASGVSAATRIKAFFAENGALLQSRQDVIKPMVPILEQGWNELPGEERMQRLRGAFTRLAAGPEQRNDAGTLGEILLGTYLVITHNWRIESDYSIADHMGLAAELICAGLSQDS